MGEIIHNIKISDCCRVDIEIPKLDTLEKFKVFNDNPILNKNKTVQKLNPSIPNNGGVYFLFYSDGRLLYIGKAGNIRSRLNGHTRRRTIREIVYKKRWNPKHIVFISWISIPDAGVRDIIETAYLRTYGTAWNNDKIDSKLTYPEAPEDEEINHPKVQEYKQKEEKLIDEGIKKINL